MALVSEWAWAVSVQMPPGNGLVLRTPSCVPMPTS